jgi:hypothetical protein
VASRRHTQEQNDDGPRYALTHNALLVPSHDPVYVMFWSISWLTESGSIESRIKEELGASG